MENKLGMVGKGIVENGVIKFMDANGRGFVAPVSKPVIQKEEIVVEKKIEVFTESIDVPDFIKVAIEKRKQEQSKVIYVNFNQGEEVEVEEEGKKEVTAEDIAEAFEDIMNHIGKKIKRNPVFKYFFGEDE